jgi:hypothetical protein
MFWKVEWNPCEFGPYMKYRKVWILNSNYFYFSQTTPFGTWIVTPFLTYRCSQLNSLLWSPSQEGFLGNLSDFSGRTKPPFKFIKDSNVESIPGYLTLLLFGIRCQHYWTKCSEYPKLPTWKNWEFLEQVKAPILIFIFEPVWIIRG